MWLPIYKSPLQLQLWLEAWASGWGMGWLQGLARNANWLSQRPTRIGASPLLRESVRHLKLNKNAPFSPPKREGAKLLYLRG